MIEVDQAIFTSAESIMAQGYRLVAASPGISADERKTIATVSPSHDSLSDKSDDAHAIAFYPLPTGRCCVAVSHFAGNEQTGRGGKRVRTHIVVLDRDQWTSVHANPFTVARAVQRATADQPSKTKGNRLPLLAIEPEIAIGPTSISTATAAVGDASVRFLLDVAMRDTCTVVPGVSNAEAIMEGVFAAMPSTMRRECSFSIGLRFAMGRRHRLIWVGQKTTDTKRRARGHTIQFAEQIADGISPQFEPATWEQLLADCLHTNRLNSFAALCDQPFANVEPDTLERLAGMQILCNHIADQTLDQLIELLRDVVDLETDGVERYLNEQLTRAAKNELIRRVDSAPADLAQFCWDRLHPFADADGEMRELCERLQEHIEQIERSHQPESTAHVDAP